MTADTRTGLRVRSEGAPDAEGRVVTVTPESAGWSHVGFQVFRLRAGQVVRRQANGEEACVVMLSGRCRAVAAGQEWPEVGGRASPFDGPPYALYVPIGTHYELEALTDGVELAIGTGPVSNPIESRVPRLITPDAVRVTTRGSGDMERTIHDILMEDQPAETLLVTEVLTPGGHWSSYPPHKHDTHDPPRETYLEELYYHRLKQTGGWAVQRVYVRDGSLDFSVAVSDGDCVLVPRGYHPVSAAPGFDLYYLNVMAGPVRQWRVTLDTDVERALHGTTWQDGDVVANGIKLHYVRTGGDKPPLVLLHGATDNGLCWFRVARELEADYDVVMLDARGHGKSDAPTEGYSSAHHARDVAGLIRGLDLRQPGIMGHSMGALTALRLASESPELVRWAVLEDPPLRPTAPGADDFAVRPPRDGLRQFLAEVRTRSRDEGIAIGRVTHPSWADDDLPAWADAKLQVSDAFLAARGSLHDRPWTELVPGLTCPTLLVTADPEQGAIVTPEIADQVRCLSAHVEVVRVAGASHNIRRDQFAAFMRALRAFLNVS